MDEATGALYSEEEEKFNCRSERDVKQRVIGMTHQLSITARMECIVLMNNWSIVNQCYVSGFFKKENQIYAGFWLRK